MEKLKRIRAILKTALSILLVAYLLLAPVFLFPTLLAQQKEINKNLSFDYLGILELWNVDTFEGGSVSRAKWLERQAVQFESEHRGTFVVVENMSLEQLQLNLQKGIKPDMISFGLGAGEFILDSLQAITSGYGVANEIESYGTWNGDTFAVPYLMGGYCKISETEGSGTVWGVGLNSNTCPLLAAVLNNQTVSQIYENSSQLNSFDVYDGYIKENFPVLIGTQRDLYRVNNRVSKLMMNPQQYEMFSGFTDLIQYLGICCENEEPKAMCELFIQKLLSDASQESLRDIHLFSVTNHNLYSEKPFSHMEEALRQRFDSLNVFLSHSVVETINQLCLKAVLGDEQAKQQVMEYL